MAIGVFGTVGTWYPLLTGDPHPGKLPLVLAAGITLAFICLVIWLFYPIRDEPEPFSDWERTICRRVLGTPRVQLCCRRHASSTAQARALGCQTVFDVMNTLTWLHEVALTVALENHLEREVSRDQLALQSRLLVGLQRATDAALAASGEFKEIARDPTSNTATKIGEILHELERIARDIQKIGIQSLDDLYDKLAKGEVDVHSGETNEGTRVREMLSVVRKMAVQWAADFDQTQKKAAALCNELRSSWRECSARLHNDRLCKPILPEA